jgi:predicted membrane chloride channel (bestrophin family)
MALILIVCFTLPRQVTMLQYLSALIQALISFSGNLRKVKNLDENALVPVNVKQYKGTIN